MTTKYSKKPEKSDPKVPKVRKTVSPKRIVYEKKKHRGIFCQLSVQTN